MSNSTYICTACGIARREKTAGGLNTAFRCASCGGPLWELSHNWRIPKKNDAKGWRELRAIVSAGRPYREAAIHRRGEALLARIDHQTAEFSKRPPSKQKEDILKDLNRERKSVHKKYFCGEGESGPLEKANPPGKAPGLRGMALE